jgi:hypothetical protein
VLDRETRDEGRWLKYFFTEGNEGNKDPNFDLENLRYLRFLH